MLLTVAATAFTFTACNDDNDGPEPVSYTHLTLPTNSLV